jgi:hypothetical protein
LSGTRSSCTCAPPSAPISPTAEDRPARAAVGDAAIEATVARDEQRVHELFLLDRVADLHRARRDGLAGLVELLAAEGGTVDAVAPGAPAGDDHEVAGAHLLVQAVDGQQADAAAVDQRVAHVALVEADRAVDRGDAHAVAVVAHAGDDALHHAPRVQRALGQARGGQVGRPEAEDVRVGDGPAAQARAERVAQHAAQARARAAVGLDGRGVVVRLDLAGEVEGLVEGDDAGVVDEDRLAEGAVELARRARDGRLEQVVDDLALVLDAAGHGLVLAVLRPGLRDGLELDVGRLAALGSEVRLHGLHLDRVERQAALLGELLEPRAVGALQLDVHEPEGGLGQLLDRRDAGLRVEAQLLDGRVREQLRAQAPQLCDVGRGGHDHRLPAPHVAHLEPQPRGRAHHALRRRVHHAGPAHDLEAVGARLAGVGRRIEDAHAVHDRVGQQPLREAPRLRLAAGDAQRPASPRGQAGAELDAHLACLRQQAPRGDVRALGPDCDLDAHRPGGGRRLRLHGLRSLHRTGNPSRQFSRASTAVAASRPGEPRGPPAPCRRAVPGR